MYMNIQYCKDIKKIFKHDLHDLVFTNQPNKQIGQRTFLHTYSEEEIQWEDIEKSHMFDIQDSEQVTKGLWLPSILQSKHEVQVSLVVLQYNRQVCNA